MKKAEISASLLAVLVCLVVVLTVPFVMASSSATHTVSLAVVGTNTPTIDAVDPIAAQDVTPGSTKTITFSFTVSDNDGYTNLNDSSASAYFTKSGETTRSNTSCSVTNIDWNTNNYTCAVAMQFYDAAGTWNVNVSINDKDGRHAENATTTFTYNTGLHMTMTPTAVSFGTNLVAGQQDVAATDDPIVITNKGNVNITQVNVTAYALIGETLPAYSISASNFEANDADAAGGDTLVNATAITVNGVTANRGASSSDSVYFYLDVPSSNIQPQTYSTSGGTVWNIGVYGTSS